MGDEGVLVPGAQPGRKGAGCFKLSAEEKGRMADAAKVAARKLKAQSKHGLGKVTYVINSRSLVLNSVRVCTSLCSTEVPTAADYLHLCRYLHFSRFTLQT